MKKLITVIFAVLTGFSTLAQMPAGAKMPEARVFGKIVDNQGKAVEFASVVLLKTTVDNTTKQPKDVMVKFQNSELNGDFNFTEVPMMGKYKLKVSSVGYKTLELPVAFAMPKMEGMTPPKPGQQPDPAMIAKMMAALEKDLGNIKLESDNTLLEGVTVTATKALLEMDIDKKVFNVDKNIVTTGGTGVDVVRNIPSLQVDIDGNVKLRNAPPTIFVDGRPTTLSLDQIPADAIEKIEIITNPSAKYDASGSVAGILNIILKKNKKSGYNGMLNIGVDALGGSNTMGNFSIRQNKWNISLMGMNMRMRTNTEGNSLRSSTIGDIYSTTSQDIESKMKGMMTFGRLSVDYNLSNRTSVSVGTLLASGAFKPTENILITNNRLETSSLSNRISESERNFKPLGIQLGLKHSFATAGEELTFDVNMFGADNSSSGLFTTNYYNTNNMVVGNQIQKNMGIGQNKFVTIQTDYTKPLKNGGLLETGLRAQINSIENENSNTLKALGTTEFKTITAAAANYNSQNDVYAGYVSASGKVNTLFNYKIGLRAESSAYDGKLLNTGESFSNSFPISLFPSVFLSKNISKTDQLQLSVTRRVNRPNFFQLIPFVDFSDSLNITRGNANLVPEFTTSSEVSYSKSIGTATFLATAYYKYTNNLITRYLNEEVNPLSGRLDLINTYINANSSENYGTEFTYTNKLKKWWDFTANLNFYNAKINIDNVDPTFNNMVNWTAFGKINNNFTLKNKWVIQLSGDYQGKTNMPVSQGQGGMGGPQMSQAQSSSQGYIKPFYGVDLAVKKTFLKNDMGSLTLAVTDILASRGNTQIMTGPSFSQEYYRLANPQMVRLTFSFRFGKMDMNMFKKNSNASSMEGMQMQ